MGFRMEWDDQKVKALADDASREGLTLAGETILEHANRSVPIDEGTLQRSGSVDYDPEEKAVHISYDTPYAVRLHENPQYNFKHGRRGKWLELTLQEQASRVNAWLADAFGRRFK